MHTASSGKYLARWASALSRVNTLAFGEGPRASNLRSSGWFKHIFMRSTADLGKVLMRGSPHNQLHESLKRSVGAVSMQLLGSSFNANFESQNTPPDGRFTAQAELVEARSLAVMSVMRDDDLKRGSKSPDKVCRRVGREAPSLVELKRQADTSILSFP